jgi:hypothetical protein
MGAAKTLARVPVNSILKIAQVEADSYRMRRTTCLMGRTTYSNSMSSGFLKNPRAEPMHSLR